jgi:hypothetical protein
MKEETQYLEDQVDSDVEELLLSSVSRISRSCCQKMEQCRFHLHVIYYQHVCKVTHMGLVGVASHSFFDGVGAYLVLHTFLSNLEQSCQGDPSKDVDDAFTHLKTSPEASIWEHIPVHIRAKDHTEMIDDITDTMRAVPVSPSSSTGRFLV